MRSPRRVRAIALGLTAVLGVVASASATRSLDWCANDGQGLSASLTTSNGTSTNARWKNNFVAELLVGKTLNVAVIWDAGVVKEGKAEPTNSTHPGYATAPSPFVICEDSDPSNTCDDWLGGRDWAIFNEAAKRGNFKVRWTLLRGPIGSETYTDLESIITLNYDLSAQWWTDSYERRGQGMVTGRYITDLSRELLVEKEAASKTLNPALMLKPFTWQAWLAFLGLTTFHSLCYYYLEFDHFKEEIPSVLEGVLTSWWLSWERFTSGLDAEPRSPHAKALQVIWGMCTLCFTALYTASLAALIIEVSVSNSAINSMSDLQKVGGRVAIFTGDPLKTQLQTSYPWLTMVEVPLATIRATTNIKSFLTQNAVQAMLIPHVYAYELEQAQSDCGMTIVANALKAGGGFATHYSECAENLHWVIDTTLMEMEFDGKMDQITLSYTPMMCQNQVTASEVSYTLDINQTYGIIAAGGVLMLLVLTLSAGHKKHENHRQRKREIQHRQHLEAVLSEMAPEEGENKNDSGKDAESKDNNALRNRLQQARASFRKGTFGKSRKGGDVMF